LPFYSEVYDIFDTRDPSIATWSDDGQSIVVKEPDRFASEIIPRYFKHNNFSSFVRQLNFYGFRKLKEENINLLDLELLEKELKFWRFKHDKFRRGRSDLLCDVRNQKSEGLDQEEFKSLKETVHTLKREVSSLSQELHALVRSVSQVATDAQKGGQKLEMSNATWDNDSNKRLRRASDSNGMLSFTQKAQDQVYLNRAAHTSGCFNSFTSPSRMMSQKQDILAFSTGAFAKLNPPMSNQIQSQHLIMNNVAPNNYSKYGIEKARMNDFNLNSFDREAIDVDSEKNMLLDLAMQYDANDFFCQLIHPLISHDLLFPNLIRISI